MRLSLIWQLVQRNYSMNSRIKILIPNATSPQNVGDAAILESLLLLLRKVYDNPEIIVHSSEYKRQMVQVSAVRSTLYYWAVFSNTSSIQRVKRILLLLVAMIVRKLQLQNVRIFPKSLQTMLDDYMWADYIVYVGGGSLRSRPGFLQSLNVVMTALPFWFGTHSSATTIVSPISFGPFAALWQEKLIGRICKRLDVVSVRERFSYDALKKYRKEVVLSEDLALFLESGENRSSYTSVSEVGQSDYKSMFTVGFTVRDWFGAEQQKIFEKEYLSALIKFSIDKPLVFQPIAQVSAVKYGDIDAKLADKFAAGLQMAGVKVLPTIVNTTIPQAQDTYSRLDLLVGMRMHSNILAATVGVPFVALSYEYKTDGLVQSLGLEEYCLKVDAVTAERLLAILEAAYQNHSEMKKIMMHNLKKIRERELASWNSILTSHI